LLQETSVVALNARDVAK